MARKPPTNPARKTKQRSAADWTPVFLQALAATGIIAKAAAAAGINRDTFYARRDKDDAFAKLVKLAMRDSTDVMESEAWRRAVEGVPWAVKKVGKKRVVIQRYSDRLLQFLLSSRSKKFRRQLHEHTHRGAVRLELAEEIIDVPHGKDAEQATDNPPKPSAGGLPAK